MNSARVSLSFLLLRNEWIENRRKTENFSSCKIAPSLGTLEIEKEKLQQSREIVEMETAITINICFFLPIHSPKAPCVKHEENYSLRKLHFFLVSRFFPHSTFNTHSSARLSLSRKPFYLSSFFTRFCNIIQPSYGVSIYWMIWMASMQRWEWRANMWQVAASNSRGDGRACEQI